MEIREAKESDLQQWSEMRSALWPKCSDNHVTELEDYFRGESIDITQAYIAETETEIVGFMELNIRSYAEGSRSPRVPYVEAWYVKPEYQGKGYGSQLMWKAEQWAKAQGFSELASDTDIENHRSIVLHKHLGFVETDRLVCFLKSLDK
jgi:aminoglycoside 6'-N-acetyltransferase I